jgi:ABC-type multidrug transport system fused ATPase/permease subunit
MIKQYYQQQLDAVETIISTKKRQDIRFSLLRFVLMLLVLGAIYFAISRENGNFMWLALLGVALFLFALRKHQDLRLLLSKKKQLKLLLEQELAALSGNDEAFEDGADFAEETHFYAHDLDVLGAKSLFQHINRSATYGGRFKLAQALLGKEKLPSIAERQAAVQELCKADAFRHAFRVEGMLIEEKPGLAAQFRVWLSHKTVLNALSHPLLLIPLAVIAIATLVLFIADPSIQHIQWFGYAFGLNLGISYLHFKKITLAYNQLGKMAGTLGMYAEMINLIEQLDARSSVVQALQQKLHMEGVSASGSLRKLKKLLDRFDQLNNVVALIFTNGLYHNHVHALRALNAWKHQHETKIEDWLSVVHEVDMLTSLANFSFNHPDYTFPELSNEPTFELEGGAHPLIPAGVRVANSIDFHKQPYVILTGSNMSGKSTFLKTLGLNLILAKIGAPVCALSMRFYPFEILSSMKLVDSISRSESYFQAEVLKLKAIKEVLDSSVPCFLLLDEILRGTNSEDKRKGTRLFMEKLQGYKALGVLATHDVDVAELADSFPQQYTTAYFESKVEGSALLFDYTLRKGICTTPNATMLMQSYGII